MNNNKYHDLKLITIYILHTIRASIGGVSLWVCGEGVFDGVSHVLEVGGVQPTHVDTTAAQQVDVVPAG